MISGMSGMQSGVIERIEFLAPCLAFCWLKAQGYTAGLGRRNSANSQLPISDRDSPYPLKIHKLSNSSHTSREATYRIPDS